MDYAQIKFQNIEVNTLNVKELLHIILLVSENKINIEGDIYMIILYLWFIKRGEYICNGGDKKVVIRNNILKLGEVCGVGTQKKLKADEISFIERNKDTYTLKEFADMFKTTTSIISLTLKNKKWKH